jgi:hypothetical protein
MSGWLVRVAYRAASRMRKRSAKHAPLVAATLRSAPDADPAVAASDADLAAVVLEEVDRLPERYRFPVVLCYLEGLTNAEAADRLGWPAGTVAGRLARARAVLRNRLARRGVAGSAAVLVAVLGGASSVPAAFPATVLRACGSEGPSPSVAQLTQEVMKAMSSPFRSLATCVLVAIGLVAAAVAVPLSARDSPPPEPPREKKAAEPKEDPALAFDEELAREKKFVLVGTVVSADGKTPLEGVEITASAGIGTLRPTGKTTTDKDGKFRLTFGAGLMLAGGKPGGVAVVHARKPGWHAWTYGWPAQFVLTNEPLSAAEMKQYGKYTNLTPGKPSRLAFRMQPAASLKVSVVDGAGRAMANTRVWLTGENLPPGASVLADSRTDAAGVLRVDDVPRSSYRLVVVEDEDGGRGRLELGSIRFRDAAEYDAVATVHEWGPQVTHVSLKVTRGRDR